MSLLKYFVFLLLPFHLVFGEVTVSLYTGEGVKLFEPFIAKTRMQEFAKFPYLQRHGDEVEALYASVYELGAVAIAYQEGEMAGFMTGIPVTQFDQAMEEFGGGDQVGKILSPHLNPKTNFYIGDVIVLEKYRGQRIVDRLFETMEGYAKSKGFTSASLISIIRDKNHPLMPANYKSSDRVWERHNYKKSGEIFAYDTPTYQTDGSLQNQTACCNIWIKNL